MTAPPKKTQQEKIQAILMNMLKDEENKYCADCDSKGPRWASWNIGVFLCIRCAGIHRNLGVHISRVKSVNLDSWTLEQLSMMLEMGNAKAKAAYEAQLPENFRRPQTDSSLEQFIRQKYEQRKYTPAGWQPPRPQARPEVLDAPPQIARPDKVARVARPKKADGLPTAPDQAAPRTLSSSSSDLSTPAATPRPAAQSKPSPPQPQAVQSHSAAPADLLVSFDEMAVGAASGTRSQPNLLVDDFFGELLSAPPAQTAPQTQPLPAQQPVQLQAFPQQQVQLQAFQQQVQPQAFQQQVQPQAFQQQVQPQTFGQAQPNRVVSSVSANDLHAVFSAPPSNSMSTSFIGGAFPTLTPASAPPSAANGSDAGNGGAMSTSAILALYGASQPRPMYTQPNMPAVQQQLAGLNFGAPSQQFATPTLQQFGRPNPFGVGMPSGPMMQPSTFAPAPAPMTSSAGASANLFDFGMPAAKPVNNLWQ